jgi:hypothetical protein
MFFFSTTIGPGESPCFYVCAVFTLKKMPDCPSKKNTNQWFFSASNVRCSHGSSGWVQPA